MIYRRFGRTNLRMPVFSCGGMRYQFKWQDVPLDQVDAKNQENLEATVRRAVDLGINHIETARGYGSSERQLGLVLPTLPRDRLIVQTKVGPTESPDEFARNFDESLERLKLDHVDLLALHGVNDRQTLEWSIRPGGCLAMARQIQKRGLARHIGFSTHATTDVILDAIAADFDYVNLHWYYIFQRNWPAIAEATRRDMGVFIISPSDKGGMLYDPPAKLVDLCRPLHPIVFNDLFCLSRPEVHTLSIGAARLTDFDLHLQSLEQLSQATQLLAPIVQRLEAALAAVTEPALRNPFDMGLPAWEQTPGQINLPVILWLRNLVRAFDMLKYGQMRYNLLGNGGHWFPGYTAAKLAETDLGPTDLGPLSRKLNLPLADLLADAHRLLAKETVKRLSQSE